MMCTLFCKHSNAQIVATYKYINSGLSKIQTVNTYVNGHEAISVFKSLSPTDTFYTDEFSTVNFTKDGDDAIGSQYYTNGSTKKIVFRDFVSIDAIFTPAIIEEPIPVFNWVLKPDTLHIAGYLCNLAFLKFRGREYKAWFTTEIPTSFGPWKFYGLPGLIINIATTDGKIRFSLTELKKMKTNIIQKPSNGKKITFKEYVKLQNSAVDEFIDKFKASLPRGATVDVKIGNNEGLELNYN